MFLIIIGVLVYSNSINSPFIYDDNVLVGNNVLIRSFSNIPVLFKDILHLEIMGNSFRPLQIITYMMDYKVWGYYSMGYHLTNMIIHIFNAILLYFLVVFLIKKNTAPFLIALFFLIHPINTQAVSYISGRADLLGALFVLASLLFYIRFLEYRKSLLIFPALLLFALGILSKEIVIFSPLIFISYEIVFKRKISKVIWLFIFISLAYVAIRSIALSNFMACPIPWPKRFLMAPLLFFKYLGVVFLPLNLRLSYVFDFVNSFWSLKFIVPFILLLVVGGVGYLVRNNKAQLFGLVWYSINFLFISNVIYPLNAPFAEHWIYLGLPGLLIFLIPVLGRFFEKISFPARGSIMLIFSLVIAYSFLTFKRNGEWSDPVVFYNKEIRFTPTNFKAHFNLGKIYFNQEKYSLAEEEFKKVLIFNPGDYSVFFALGLVKEKKNDFKNAIIFYQESLRLNPGFKEAEKRLNVLK
ncbi:MAG: tetratricopeptide repeat protein [Candidatus Saelkia tenebricola]|nr:tetratricopeptide repeat protein [Candidatus Saelkia tenebricola]